MPSPTLSRVRNAIFRRWVHHQNNRRWKSLSKSVQALSPVLTTQKPVIVFNASTRLAGVSQNAAYSRLVSLSLRAQGVPVIHFVCQAGLQRCVLGSNRDIFDQAPPCAECVRQSQALFPVGEASSFVFEADEDLAFALEKQSVAKLSTFEYKGMPLGFWAVNSLRWMLRRYRLLEDLQTRAFLVSFILSAWSLAQQFESLLIKTDPQAALIFNGMFYPEAAARWLCQKHGVRVITHEVGIQPFSGFFTEGEATAYPMHIAEDFQLTPEMDERLNEYLSNRFQGNFTMAGIRFWPEMQKFDPSLASRIALYRKVVPIFTNVIFDTSQVHANTLFTDMFQWLENLVQPILDHPEVLFVIRAHPDESRKGKESRESVADWVQNRGLLRFSNVVFLDSNRFVSSYELIRRAHFVMNYNSTIGLEATLLDKPVLTAGKARYTQIPTTVYPSSRHEYLKTLEQFIKADEIDVPPEFIQNARRFLYAQLFLTSLPFGDYVKDDGVWNGYVALRDFSPADLLPERSETMRVIANGILHGKEFQRDL